MFVKVYKFYLLGIHFLLKFKFLYGIRKKLVENIAVVLLFYFFTFTAFVKRFEAVLPSSSVFLTLYSRYKTV